MCAAVCAAALFLTGAPSQSRGQYSRRTPIVEAVQKTRGGIVTVKAEKQTTWDQPKEVLGTGVVVDERGFLVTNGHVVAGATQVNVLLADGTTLPAEVLKEDTNHDLAVLRVHAGRKLPALPLGPGGDLMVGETVIAVGHPFGYQNSVSTGIVSALNRSIAMPSGHTLTGLIQTDTSINPGNSGGPLLNINGELIGVVVALREGAQGIAFAINADTVKQTLAQQLSAARMAGLTHGLACSETVVLPEGPERQRLIVTTVGTATPAALAGLKPGDEVRRVGQQAVTNRFDLERALWEAKPGEKVPLTVVRQGKELALTLTPVSSREAEPVLASQDSPHPDTVSGERGASTPSQER
jgi:serine protease Do